MLTADLVRARRKGTQLLVGGLTSKTRPRALQLAQELLDVACSPETETFGDLKDGWASLAVGAREKKLADGLAKLVEDRCDFERPTEPEPRELRRRLFLRAAQVRRRLGPDFRRERVLQEIGNEYGLSAVAVDAALFSDLKTQHRMVKRPTVTAEALVAAYSLAEHQAVLLRAVRVTARVRCNSVGDYRNLFRALKFRRLLFVILPEEDGYRIEIDGPFSLFESVTKYGLQLAMVFPYLLACTRLELSAEVRWGKARTPLTFAYEHKRPRSGEEALATPELGTELERFFTAFGQLGSAWDIRLNERIHHLPGLGVCIPDFVFERQGTLVYLEVMGYWSRDAVFNRVELVKAGLGERLLFAVSNRLRVSEAVLADTDVASLLVYKGALSPKAVLRKLEVLAQTPPPEALTLLPT